MPCIAYQCEGTFHAQSLSEYHAGLLTCSKCYLQESYDFRATVEEAYDIDQEMKRRAIASKISLNTSYPIAFQKEYRPYDPELTAAITKAGQELLRERYADNKAMLAYVYFHGVERTLEEDLKHFPVEVLKISRVPPLFFERRTRIESGNNADFALKKRW